MTTLSPVGIPALLGYLALAAILRNTAFQGKKLFLFATAIPTGFGICSLVLFFALWMCPSQVKFISWTIIIGAIMGLGVFLSYKHFQQKPFLGIPKSSLDLKTFLQRLLQQIPKSPQAALKLLVRLACLTIFLITLWTIVRFFILSSSTNITGGWDARYFWSLKAKYMFRSPEDWATIFSPKLFWTHPDYPLLWPGTLSWGWHSLGYEALLWVPWASLCFYVSCAFVLIWYIGAYISKTSGWLAGTFFFMLIPPLFWSIHQYADVPLTFFITTSGLTLAAAFRSGQPGLLIVSGLMAGFAAWTKNEGLLFLFWTCLLLGGMGLFRLRKTPSQALHSFSFFYKGASIPLLSVVLFKLFLGRTGDYVGPSRSAQDYLALVFSGWERLATILRSFWDHMSVFQSWKGLWIFFFLASFVLISKKEKKDSEAILLFLVLMTNFGCILAFLTTTYELQFQIETSLERILIHTAPLALAFAFEMLTLFPRDVSRK